MKKLFTMLLFLFALYLGIQFAFVYFGKGEDYSYEIEKDGLIFGINEVSNFRTQNNIDNYYYNVFVNDKKFSFQVNHDFSKMTQVIKDIEYFKSENYECILPVFKNGLLLSDVICYTNDELTYYHNLVGQNSDLDRFTKGIKIYDGSKYIDNSSDKTIEGVVLYEDNLIEDHYIVFSDYRGIFNISKNFNSRVYDINLYKNDERNPKISAFYDRYYICADYDQEYEFNEFNVVNLVELDTYNIVSNSKISTDSYIQGVVDNKIYLYDKDNKKQYEINVDNKTVVESSSNIKYYKNGEWTTMTVAEANNELKFIMNEKDYENNLYSRIDKVGDNTGYYYMYKKAGSTYKAYRMNIQDKEDVTYLFTTKSIDNIVYKGNYIYFISGSDIKVYHDEFGVKKVAHYKELEFNSNVNFNVYVK